MGTAKEKFTEEMLGESHSLVRCKHCGQTYRQTVVDQVPGFRDMDEDTCPYCHSVNGQSMSVEYINSKM